MSRYFPGTAGANITGTVDPPAAGDTVTIATVVRFDGVPQVNDAWVAIYKAAGPLRNVVDVHNVYDTPDEARFSGYAARDGTPNASSSTDLDRLQVDGTWYAVKAVYDPSSGLITIHWAAIGTDGTFTETDYSAQTAGGGAGPRTDGTKVYLGTLDSGSNPFKGWMRNVLIAYRALTAQEDTDYVTAGTLPTSNVEVALPLAVDLDDDGPKGHTFTATGVTQSSTEPPWMTNQPPVADPGINQTVAGGGTIVLDGTGSYDPDGTITSAVWRLVDDDGTGATDAIIDDTATLDTFATAPTGVDASLVFGLVVVDDDGAASTEKTITVTVTSGNQPPTVSAGPAQTVAEGTVTTLAGDASDPDGTVVAHQWEPVTGDAPALSSTAVQQPTVDTTGATAGTYTYRYRAQDDDGTWSPWATTTITVVYADEPVAAPMHVWHLFQVPGGAATIDLEVVVPRLTGQTVVLDRASVRPDGRADWSRGGLAGLTTIDLERRVDGGVWEPVRHATGLTPDTAGRAATVDVEIVDGVEVAYRAVAAAVVDDQPLSSGASDPTTVTPTQNPRHAVVVAPADPTLAATVEALQLDDPTRGRRAAVYTPVDADAPDVVVAAGWSAGRGTLTMQVATTGQRQAILDLLYAGETIYLARPRETGDGTGTGRWIELVGEVTPQRRVTGRWDPARTIGCSWVEVPRPEVG